MFRPRFLRSQALRHFGLESRDVSYIQAGGAPEKVRLFGENLVAFRSPDGSLGLMQEACPHRCASLFFGRNEEGGIRCVYHGWKFDTDGKCLDMANVPPHQDFKHKVHAKAYKTEERNGLVWVFMGDQASTLTDKLYDFSAPHTATSQSSGWEHVHRLR